MKTDSKAERIGAIRKYALHIILPAVMLALFACFSIGTADVRAESNSSRIGDVNGVEFSSFSELNKYLKGRKGYSAKITMYQDWDAAADGQFDARLYIPEDCDATLEMHGYMFNRNNVYPDEDDDSDGELIYVDTGAKLTINGASTDAEKERMHTNVRVYTDVEQDEAPGTTTIKGGCLAGGEGNCGTGGIFIDSGEEVILNDVSIAGCKAYDPYFGGDDHSGYGGGIIITEPGTKLTMNNSVITGCLAQEDGGGIYAQNDNKVRIELNNSRVDYNYADDDGGGITLDGEHLSIYGKNGSSISRNKCTGYGGGVYFSNDDVDLIGDKFGDIVIDSNEARQGGGVYLDETTNYLEDLFITNNKSTDEGGGVYVDNYATTINTCKITGNNKCGVYITSGCDEDMWIKGATFIDNNKSGNLILTDDSSYLNFTQSNDMHIRIRYEDLPDDDGYDITNGVTLDYSGQLIADDAGYLVAYSYRDTDQDNGRRLRYIKKSKESDTNGHSRENPDIFRVRTQDIHGKTVTTKHVYAGGYTDDEGGEGTRYQLRSVVAHHTLSGDKDFQSYYTDGYFLDESGESGDPIPYNNHLATSSYALASCGAFLDSYDYDIKHLGARQFMSDIGCPDQMIYVNDSNTREPGADSIGLTIGSKVLQKYDGNNLVDTDYILVAIGMRSANYGNEWASNVTLGDGDKNDGEAQGFTEAADQTMQAIEAYITRYGLKDAIHQGRVKFWIAGFSRGGAAANITAKRLIEKYCVDTSDPSITVETGNDVFAYTLEAPKGGTDKAEHLDDKTQYYRIHNLVNTGDIVTYVAPEEMGFKRYGVDHYVPGTYVGRKTRQDYINSVKSHDAEAVRPKWDDKVTVTTYTDNNYLDTKKNMDSEETDRYKEYVARRDNMVKHLATVVRSTLFNDYFYPYATSVNLPPMKKMGDFDGTKLEDFLPNFMSFLQKHGFRATHTPMQYREDYAVYRVMLDGKFYDNLQNLARDYFLTGGEPKSKFATLMKAVDKLRESIWTELDVVDTIGKYNTINYSDEKKTSLIQDLWDTASERGAFNGLTQAEIDVVHKYWFTIMDPALNFANADWLLGSYGYGEPVYPKGKWLNGNAGSWIDAYAADRLIYSLTLSQNIDMIININHDRGVGIAWARTYDSYYTDHPDYDKNDPAKTGRMQYEYSEYKANWILRDGKDDEYNPNDYSVDVPKAYIKADDPNATEPYKQLNATTDENDRKLNSVKGRTRILLEVGEIYDNVSPADKAQGKDGDYFGEAIFYELVDITDPDHPKPFVGNNLYRGGVDLPNRQGGGKYKITAYAVSLGKKSEEVTYYFTLGHKVTVDDGSAKEPVVSFYPSGELVTISANPATDKYFSHWKVALLNEDGTSVPGADDIASAVLAGKQGDAIVTFSMPQSGSEYAQGGTYPEGYALEITAVCKDRISKITISTPEHELVPVGGESLPETTNVKVKAGGREWVPQDDENIPIDYQISWTYSYTKEGEKIVVPTSGTAYRNTDYTATIVVPQNKDKDIMFLPTGENLKAVYGGSKAVKSVSITRNDADGSAIVVIEFNPTGDDGPQPPETVIPLEISCFDQNMKANIENEGVTYHVLQGQELVIYAPLVDDEKFYAWNFGESGVSLAEGYELTDKIVKVIIPEEVSAEKLSISAKYIPVISSITATLDAPAGGQTMQTQARGTTAETAGTLKVTISHQYEIDPEFVKIDWSPAPLEGNKADYLKNYTATIKLVPKQDDEGRYIMVKGPNDATYRRVTATFLYSEGLSATVNNAAASVDKVNNSISYTFPVTAYKIVKVYPPQDVPGIPYGTSEEGLKTYLPQIEIELDDGRVITASANWTGLELAYDPPDEYSMQVWKASGGVQLPYGVSNPDEIDLGVECKLNVAAAEGVGRVVPSVDAGEYLEDQRTSLSTETEGATIYWTTDTQATENIKEVQSDSRWQAYDIDMIELNREDATEYEYGPDGKQTGRKKITLKVAAFKNGMRPDGVRSYVYIFGNELNVPEGYDHVYDGNTHIGVHGSKFYTLEAVSEGVTIDDKGNATATKIGTYKVKATIREGFKWQIVDPETGEITDTTDDQVISFTISDKNKYTITFNLKGGELGGKTGVIRESYYEGTVIKMPEPKRKGYTFRYWKGSRYKAGAKYTVKEDHTFTAKWKKGSGGSARTGDDSAVLLWILLLITAAGGMTSMLLIRFRRR